jgi:hypothetical protein
MTTTETLPCNPDPATQAQVAAILCLRGSADQQREGLEHINKTLPVHRLSRILKRSLDSYEDSASYLLVLKNHQITELCSVHPTERN